MTTIEGSKVIKYTEYRLLCPNCQRNNNFELVVRHEGSQYYLGEKCPKCEHFEDFKSVPYRIAAEYLPVKK